VDGVALGLVLTAAVVHAGWNLAAKRVEGSGESFVYLYVTVGALVTLPVGVVYVVAEGVHPHWSWLLAALVTGIFHVLYGITLQRGYSAGDLSIVYPTARGSGPLIVVIVAVLFLSERPGPIGLMGAFLVVAGVFVVGSAGRRTASSGRRARRLGIAWGLATGATIAAYTLWDNHAVNALAVPPLAYFPLGVVMQSALLAGVAAGRAPTAAVWSSHRREVLIVGVLSPVAYILVLYAMQMAPVSLVAPAREVSIVFGGVAAWFVLREQHPLRRLAGSVVVLTGIAAIALASR
jgi:drug/metabolite transporter (DMT)-like permease